MTTYRRIQMLLLAACSWAVAQPTVVTSIHPYFDLVRQLAGRRAEVVRLLPPGASPHTFDPTPRDVARVAAADLIVLNGRIDTWLEGLIDASGSQGSVLVILDVIDLALVDGDRGAEVGTAESDRDDDLSGVNPHVWLDPLAMVQAVEALSERLAELDPEYADGYRSNAAALVADLIELDRELAVILACAQGAPFVPFHDAWPHFARRYGLNLIVEIEPFPGREPSPRYLVAALAQIAAAEATAVFAERQLNGRPAEVVAESAGVDLYILDPLGGTEGLDSYQQLLRYNASVIAAALQFEHGC